MAALTKGRELQTMFPRQGFILPINAAAATYYKGGFLGFLDAGGNILKAGVAGAPKYAGICQEDIKVLAGEQIDVLVNAPFWFDNAVLAVKANITKKIYADNDGDLTLTAQNNTFVGRIAAIKDGSMFIDPIPFGAS